MLIITHRVMLKIASGEIAIDIRLYMPARQGADWGCLYEIDWPEGTKSKVARGFDALQALMIAVQMIGADLYTSTYHASGRLRALGGEEGYGFPVPKPIRHLLVGQDAAAYG
jgi:hypothetical protein